MFLKYKSSFSADSWEFNGTINRTQLGDNMVSVLVNKLNVTGVVRDQLLPTGLIPLMEKFELKEIIIFEGITKVAWGPNAKAVGFSGR